MTIEQMKDEIRKECNRHTPVCYENGGCPLFRITKTDCWNCATDEEVIEHYKLCYPDEVVDEVLADTVNHPSHYNQGGIECIDAMIAAFGKEKVCDFCIMNAFKYLWRYQHKNGFEDVKKASWYINKYMELMEELFNGKN